MKSFIQYLLEFDPNKGAKGRRQRDAMFKAYSQGGLL